MQIILWIITIIFGSYGSIVSMATRLLDGVPRVWIPQGAKDFLFMKMSRQALGPSQPPIQQQLGFLPRD